MSIEADALSFIIIIIIPTWANLKHPLKVGRNGHLLVQLRRLSQVGRLLKVPQLEDT